MSLKRITLIIVFIRWFLDALICLSFEVTMTLRAAAVIITDIEIEIQSIIWNVNIQRIGQCRFEESENSRIEEERLVQVYFPQIFW